MSQETIPLTFEAIDRLSSTVDKMTSAVDKLTEAQGDSAKASEETAQAQGDQADSLGKLEKVLSVARNGIELATKGWEAAKVVYEAFSNQIGNSLSKWDEYSKKTGKAASSLGGIGDASARAEKAQDRTYRAIGRTIEASGLVQIGYDLQREALDKLTSLIDQYDESIVAASQDLAAGLLVTIKQGTEFVRENAESFAALFIVVKNGGLVVGAAGDAFQLLYQTLKLQVLGALALTSAAVVKLIEGLSAVIKAAGGDVPQALEDARLGMEAFSNATKTGAINTLDDMIVTADDATRKLMTFGANVGDALTGANDELATTAASLKAGADAIDGVVDRTTKKLNSARGNQAGRAKLGEDAQAAATATALLKLEDQIADARAAGNEQLTIELERQKAIAEGLEAARSITNAQQKQLTISVATKNAELDATEKLLGVTERLRAEDEARAAERQAVLDQAIAASQTLVSLDAQRLTLGARMLRLQGDEGSALEAAALEREAARLQLAVELEGIENEVIRAQTEKIRLQEIELDYTEQLAEVQAASMERITAIGEAARSGFEGLGELLGELDDDAASFVETLERGFGAATQLAQGIAKLSTTNKGYANSQEAVTDAISGSVGLAGSLVSAFTDNVKTRAKWEAAFNAAAAIAAGAMSFANPAYIPVAVGHAAAAVKFGLVASGALGGGGGGGAGASAGGGGGGGGAASASQGPSLDLDRERRLTAEAVAESIAAQAGGGATTIIIDFGSSLIASTSPQAAQDLADLIAPELERRIAG